MISISRHFINRKLFYLPRIMLYLSDLLLRRDVLRVVVEDVHDAGGGGGGCFTFQFKSNKVLLTNSKNCTCAIIIA